MKALIITDNLVPNSGIGRYSQKVVSEYAGLGVEPTVVTLRGSGTIINERSVLLTHASLVNFIKNILLVRKLSKDFTVIHAFDIWPFGVYAYFAVLGTDKQLFLNGVGTYSIAPSNFSLKKIFINLAYKRAKKIFCISDYTAEKIKERFKDAKTKVVYLGLSTLPEPDLEIIERVRSKYNINVGHPVFITVGEIKHRKGQLDTLRALCLLKDKLPNFLYVMIGGNEDHVYISQIRQTASENGLTDNIRIITGVDDVELVALYKSADVFCLNSNNDGGHFEGFGLVILEAGQFRLPAIGSRNCGIESAIKNGYNGLLTNQGDPVDIAQKIIELINSENIDKMRNQAQEYAHLFNWNETAKNYISEYE